MPHSTATPFVLSSLLEKKSNIKVAGGRRLLKEERGGGVKEVKTKILSLGGLFPCPSGPNMFKEGVKRVSASLLALRALAAAHLLTTVSKSTETTHL